MTELATIIKDMRTNGGAKSESDFPTYADQNQISFATGDDVGTKEGHFAQAAFLMWAELINMPTAFVPNQGANITFSYSTDVPDDASGVTTPSVFFPLDHHYEIKINRSNSHGDSNLGIGVGDYFTYLHEIGHAFGLSHPGNYNGGTPATM